MCVCVCAYCDLCGHVIGCSQETAGFSWDIGTIQYSHATNREESRSGTYVREPLGGLARTSPFSFDGKWYAHLGGQLSTCQEMKPYLNLVGKCVAPEHHIRILYREHHIFNHVLCMLYVGQMDLLGWTCHFFHYHLHHHLLFCSLIIFYFKSTCALHSCSFQDLPVPRPVGHWGVWIILVGLGAAWTHAC